MISAVDEALGRHLKAIHFAAELCNVSDEVSVLVAFLSVSCVNVPLRWACELKQVDGFLVVVNNHNVWPFCSHTELWGNRATPWCCVPW